MLGERRTIAVRIEDIPARVEPADPAVPARDCSHGRAGPIWGGTAPGHGRLALAGPRVSGQCRLNVDDTDLTKARFYIEDAKTLAGIRDVDIHPRLLDELTAYTANRPPSAGEAPAFSTRDGTRRNKDNVRPRVIAPAVARANELRAAEDGPPIRAHITTHTFRRTCITCITCVIAAGYDPPYVQAQVGHDDPSVTLSIYAQVMRRADREQLKAEIRELLGVAQRRERPIRTRSGRPDRRPSSRFQPPICPRLSATSTDGRQTAQRDAAEHRHLQDNR
jgi:integrase